MKRQKKHKSNDELNLEEEQKRVGKRMRFEATVLSQKMEKTVKVKVTRRKAHPLYNKVLTMTKKYLVLTDKKLKPGDRVLVEQCKPISKRKKWRIVEVLSKDKGK